MNAHTDTPNLDSLSLDELRIFADAAEDSCLRSYALFKIKAIEARLTGNIARALACEECCEMAYEHMPEDLRW